MGVSSQLIHRRELLSTIDHLLFVLFVLSYLLSPSNLITLIIRLLTQTQFTTPKRFEGKPLRFFLLSWFGINLFNFLVHFINGGSKGIKGRNWNSSSGLLLDFIGQSYKTSLFQLLLLDLLIASLQFVLIVISYGDSYSVGDGKSILLGSNPEDMDEEDDEDSEEREERNSDDELTTIIKSKFDSTGTTPILNIRFRVLAKEVTKNFWSSSSNDATSIGMRSMEEGRSRSTVT